MQLNHENLAVQYGVVFEPPLSGTRVEKYYGGAERACWRPARTSSQSCCVGGTHKRSARRAGNGRGQHISHAISALSQFFPIHLLFTCPPVRRSVCHLTINPSSFCLCVCLSIFLLFVVCLSIALSCLLSVASSPPWRYPDAPPLLLLLPLLQNHCSRRLEGAAPHGHAASRPRATWRRRSRTCTRCRSQSGRWSTEAWRRAACGLTVPETCETLNPKECECPRSPTLPRLGLWLLFPPAFDAAAARSGLGEGGAERCLQLPDPCHLAPLGGCPSAFRLRVA
jgi:hypothetical protein